MSGCGKGEGEQNKRYHQLAYSIRMASSVPPGGQRILQKRRQAQSVKEKQAKQTPTSARQAGHGGSSSSVLKLYTDEANGFRVDSLVVLFLSAGFIFSVIGLHLLSKFTHII